MIIKRDLLTPRVVPALLFVVAIILLLPLGCAANNSLIMATNAQNRGDFQEAALLYQVAVKSDSNNAIAYYNLGTCLLQLHNYDEAEHAFEKSIRRFRSAPSNSMWTFGGRNKTNRQMLATAIHDLGVSYYNRIGTSPDNRIEMIQKAIRYFNEAISLDSSLKVAKTNLALARKQPLGRPGASKTIYLDADQKKIWTAKLLGINLQLLDSLAKSGAEHVLLLPIQGTSYTTLPDPAAMKLTWPHGSIEAEREAISNAHQLQNIPRMQSLIETGLTALGVLLVARDSESIKVILDERDLAAVFGSSQDMVDIGRLTHADAVCSTIYNQFYDCYIEYANGIPKQPVNHTKLFLSIKCANVHNGDILFKATADTEVIRTSPKDKYGILDPYFVLSLALFDSSFYTNLQQSTIRNPEVLLARAIARTHPMFPKKLRDTELANSLINEAKGIGIIVNTHWLYTAEFFYAMAIGDSEKLDESYQALMAECPDWATWWHKSIRTLYTQFKDMKADNTNP